MRLINKIAPEVYRTHFRICAKMDEIISSVNELIEWKNAQDKKDFNSPTSPPESASDILKRSDEKTKDESHEVNFKTDSNSALGDEFREMRDTDRTIEVLGWQSEGFWCWNNKVSFTDGSSIDIPGNGMVEIYGVKYYIPSADRIYANTPRYQAQKRFSVSPSPAGFQRVTNMMLRVHGDHAITGLLFTIASFFQDIVVSELGYFPILFLHGPSATGKSKLMECCQSFFGEPLPAIDMEGGASTIHTNIDKLARFSNGMVHLSEYHPGDNNTDAILKGLWDRRAYTQGNAGTESVPIRSSVGMTGNGYPDNETLIPRLITEEMTRTSFSAAETCVFEKLQEYISVGISSLGDDLLMHREHFEENFLKQFFTRRHILKCDIPGASSRMVSNVSVLAATYEVFEGVLDLPFDHRKMIAHFVHIIEAQMRRLKDEDTPETNTSSTGDDLSPATTKNLEYPDPSGKN